MTKSAEFILSGMTVAGLTFTTLSCGGNEGQQSINPSQSPLAGNAKTEATAAETPVLVRPATPTELASWIPASAPTSTRMPETPTAAPATKTPFPPTKVPDTATAVPPTKVPDTATAVATAPATAAATAPAKIETPRFTSYGVYKGLAENGGSVVFATLPNRDVIFSSDIQEPRCSVRDYYEFVFDAIGKYQADLGNFAFPAGSARTKVVRVLLKNGETAEGSVLEKGYSANSPKGPFTCPANEVKFTAKLVGEGKEALIQAWGDSAVAGGFTRPTRSQVISQIENAYKGTLPPD